MIRRDALLAQMVALGYIPPGNVIRRPFWDEYGPLIGAVVAIVALAAWFRVRRSRRAAKPAGRAEKAA
ncbi:MAG TPA: hypothetical protein VFG37_07020 [Planctomycetota bacterium]|nr:hypothetical protein [Planctomycetota bacterium]